MDELGLPGPRTNGSKLNGGGLYELVRAYGCPMMDDTPWDQDESGEFFVSPVGIGTAAFWLPCTSFTEGAVPPGTCDACVVHRFYRVIEGK
jgi:hypothetical protein